MNENDVKREQAIAAVAKGARKRRRRVRWQFLAVVTVFLLGILAALCMTVLFPVREIVVEGNTRYSPKNIIEVSAVETGENMLLLDADRATDRILSQLPFIGECSLSKNISGTLTVSVAELEGTQAYKSGEKYYITNKLGKIIEEKDTEPEELCIIIGAECESAVIGEAYQPSVAEKSQMLSDLTNSIQANEITVTRIELREDGTIRFVVEGRLMVEFGNGADLEYKMSHLSSTLGSMSGNDEGTLDMTWWTTEKRDAYFRRGNITEIIYGKDHSAVDKTSSNTDSSLFDDVSGDMSDNSSDEGDQSYSGDRSDEYDE